MSFGPGVVQRKILLLLLGGLSLSFSRSPRQYFSILKEIRKKWKKINQQSLQRAIRSLYKNRLITEKYNRDGTITLALSDAGRKRALIFNLNEMSIKKPKTWDKKWRIILFDIPENRKKIREALRFHLQRLGFRQLQKSVFVYPYPCDDEVDFLIEFYQIKSFVRKMFAVSIDNELYFKQKFSLFNS
ncbi:MAG: hypothetical protein HYV52_03465 [Parcubacteria group bacterium]|nr:hypothetical protein [Parcubacteria group bacterium]